MQNNPVYKFLERQNAILKELQPPVKNSGKNNNCAIIIETRNLPELEHIIRNVMLNLDNKWNLRIYCSDKNFEEIKKKFQGSDAVVSNLGIENLNPEQYNKLLQTTEFWKNIPEENILIFQTDCVVFSGFNINYFLDKNYSYIGAPYNVVFQKNLKEDILAPEKNISNINGGFSFRKKSLMIKCLENISYDSIIKKRKEKGLDVSRFINRKVLGEDVYFHNALYLLNENLPTEAECIKFCFEIPTPGFQDSHAIHAFEKGNIPFEILDYFCGRESIIMEHEYRKFKRFKQG